jgi:hypothetical protein
MIKTWWGKELPPTFKDNPQAPIELLNKYYLIHPDHWKEFHKNIEVERSREIALSISHSPHSIS